MIEPTQDEIDELRSTLGVRALRKVRFAGNLCREAGGMWKLNGELGATVIQSCVVTLRSVTTRMDESVSRTLSSQIDFPGPNTVSAMPEDDSLELLSDVIDLFHILTEEISLALPDYPRHADAMPAENPIVTEARTSPFSVLAELKTQG